VHPAHAFALSLPEAVEQGHHGLGSFRVRGKIFATLPDEDHLRVMADEGEIRAAVAEHPAAFAEMWWGSRLSCVVVDLRVAPADQVRELLTVAWRRKAPRTLVRAFDAAAPAPAPHEPSSPHV
jgi:hypothetical protein